MFDKTCFITTHYTEESGDKDFVNTTLDAYRIFLKNRLVHKAEKVVRENEAMDGAKEELLKRAFAQVDDASNIQTMLNFLCSLISSTLSGNQDLYIPFHKYLAARLGAVSACDHSAVHGIDVLLVNMILQEKEITTTAELDQLLTDGKIEQKARDDAEQVLTRLKGGLEPPKSPFRKVGMVKIDLDNEEQFFDAINSAKEAGSDTVSWDNNEIPIAVAEKMAEAVAQAMKDVESPTTH